MRILILLLICTSAFARSYNTVFPGADENPLSEGGNWVNGGATGLDWHDMNIAGHISFGPSGFDVADSSALLTGSWKTNQDVSGTLFLSDFSQSPSSPEVELRMRCAISAHVFTGYECLYSVRSNGNYISLVSWDGGVGAFHTLVNAASPMVLTNGSAIRATVIGTQITMYANGVIQIQTNDVTWLSGAPGIGTDQSASKNGFTSFSASDFDVLPTTNLSFSGKFSMAGSLKTGP